MVDHEDSTHQKSTQMWDFETYSEYGFDQTHFYPAVGLWNVSDPFVPERIEQEDLRGYYDLVAWYFDPA